MKKILLLFLGLLLLNGCERDDICIDDITPRLVIRLYNAEDITSFKPVTDIEVQLIGIDTIYTGETITTSTDSIAIPLRVDQNFTQFFLTKNKNSDTDKNTDTLTITYTLNPVFVGRSCGYKDIFSAVTYKTESDDNSWIKNIESVSSTIENEDQAHVKIYH